MCTLIVITSIRVVSSTPLYIVRKIHNFRTVFFFMHVISRLETHFTYSDIIFQLNAFNIQDMF